jgi:lysozyme family protein
MADVKTAIDYVIGFEDSTLSGVITETPDGKHTRFGIDEHDHPELTNCLFYGSMGSMAALKIAESIYEREYADPLCIAEIQNQPLANKLLSLGVNCGVVTIAKILQGILGVSGDGRIGPLTLDAIDKADQSDLLDRLRAAGAQHYLDLIAANPSLAEYKKGWLARAEA